jgi:hypothetical protein
MNVSRHMKQTVTYWAPLGTNSYGARQFAAPVQLKARWEDVGELFRSPSGQEVVSKAKVFTPSAVDLGGYLYLGTSAATDPKTVANAREILSVREMPDLRLLTQMWTSML